MANDKEVESDVELLLIRASAIASRVQVDISDLEFSSSDIVAIAGLLQREEERHNNMKSTIDPATGKWVTQKK